MELSDISNKDETFKSHQTTLIIRLLIILKKRKTKIKNRIAIIFYKYIASNKFITDNIWIEKAYEIFIHASLINM